MLPPKTQTPTVTTQQRVFGFACRNPSLKGILITALRRSIGKGLEQKMDKSFFPRMLPSVSSLSYPRKIQGNPFPVNSQRWEFPSWGRRSSSFNVFWVLWLGFQKICPWIFWFECTPLKFNSEFTPEKWRQRENILSFWERCITFQGEGKRRESLNWNIYIHFFWRVVTGSPQKIEDLRLASKCTFEFCSWSKTALERFKKTLCRIRYVFFQKSKLPSLKLTKTPLKIGRARKGK